ncbi:MAG: AraC family transcriptional regulator [Micromonosporaceae bacterium]
MQAQPFEHPVHVDPEVVREVCEQHGGARGLPLFRDPVVDDPVLAARVRTAAAALLEATDPLAVQEAVDALVVAATGHATGRYPPESHGDGPPGVLAAARDLLHASFAGPVSADDLARATGASRFAVYRAFQRRYGMSPSAYLRQLRLRAARRALAAGEPVSVAAAAVGFADQAHLTRWFRRAYGITPAQYQRARMG